ncbi:MAG: sodium/proline symporter [Lachnospiraceae bacterium]|nr:sodium/proline symporter [Lachnospiraceae bacterium]
MSSQLIMAAVMFIYLAGMILIGIFYAKKVNSSSKEFYLGGRKLSPLVTAMSAEASDMSSYLLMGLPGLAYFFGVADVGWTIIGLAAGTYLNWLLVARRLRIYSEEIDAYTVPGFFSRRFGDEKHLLSLIAALIIVIFFIPYTASGFAAVGKLFHSLFGFDYMKAMLAGAAVIIAYTLLGGFLAVSTTDLIQSIVMTVSLFVIVGFGISLLGGFGAVAEAGSTVPGYLDLFATANISTGESGTYGFFSIVSTLAWGLGYFGMPHILLRFMGAKDPGSIKISRRIASVWVVISMGIAMLIGIMGFALSRAGYIETFASSSAAESVIVQIAELLGQKGTVPILAAGIVLSGILAATMSTADSQLLASSSSVSEDILSSVFHFKLSKKTTMWIARFSVIIISVIAVILARDPDSSVFGIVSFAWAGFGATFAPVMLSALFWKRANKWGALAGMISGAVMIFVWKYLVRPIGGGWDIYELLPAFLTAFAMIIAVSLLTEAPDKEVTDVFDRVNNKLKAVRD